jgi:hypothetical protein
MSDVAQAVPYTATRQQAARKTRKTAYYLHLRPLESRDRRELWEVRLEPDVLTLLSPEDDSVLQLHREEAARYVRFAYDVLRERTISFVIIDGLKSYSFRCGKEEVMKLLSWLPQKEPEKMAKEVTVSALAVCLFGVLHLVLQQPAFTVCGVLLLAGGIMGVARPRRVMYALNGALMILVGLWDLFPHIPVGIDPRAIPPEQHLLSVIAGSVLILWGIQQLAMLEPNQQLRTARALRDEHVSFLPGRSDLVRLIGRWHLIAAGMFAVHAAIVFVTTHFLIAESAGGALCPDFLVSGALAVVALGAGCAYVFRERPAYFEAKVSAQFLIAAMILLGWGLVLNFSLTAPLSMFSGVLSGDMAAFARAYVWASMLPAVLCFNRWFTASVDQELEEQRA